MENKTKGTYNNLTMEIVVGIIGIAVTVISIIVTIISIVRTNTKDINQKSNRPRQR